MRTPVSMAILAIAFASVPILGAPQAPDMVQAPLPSQIYTAKKAFISNAGSDPFPGAFSRPDRTYNQFYGAMKGWGHYELVLAPADADLIFEIRFAEPIGTVSIVNGMGGSVTDPQLRLVILDPKTHVALWEFTEHVRIGLHEAREKNLDQLIVSFNKTFDQAIANLVADVKSLAVQPPAKADGAKP